MANIIQTYKDKGFHDRDEILPNVGETVIGLFSLGSITREYKEAETSMKDTGRFTGEYDWNTVIMWKHKGGD